MSADHQMSKDFELPKELRKIESQLRQLSPTTLGSLRNGPGRDALMYRTGWAAAEAHDSRHRSRFWPATSAALAACLLFLLTQLAARPLQRTANQTEKPTAHPSASQQVLASQPRFTGASIPPVRTYPPQAAMLAMRDRALRFEFDEPAVISFAAEEFVAPRTSRELLQELLPSKSTPTQSERKPRSWWSIFRPGESA